MLPFSSLDPYLLLGGLRAVERETLRTDHHNRLSQRSHSEALGVSANDPMLTLDFAESQLEIVTRPYTSLSSLQVHFEKIDTRVRQKLGKAETLWLYSMPPPCSPEEIRIADFGEGEEGRQKHLYREGLSDRYGKIMQIISGVHYNFSFAPALFSALHQNRNDVYFHVIRNFWRFYPLLIYLSGASPFCFEGSRKAHVEDASFLSPLGSQLYLGEQATSLRLSELGYHNPDVPELDISYANLEAYLACLRRATSTLYEPYRNLPRQLNSYYLQQAEEHYAPIRPKGNPALQKRPEESLAEGGVHYLEIRIFDLNSLYPLGFDLDLFAFVDLFLLYCLFCKEAPFHLSMYKKQALEIAKFGRNNEAIRQKGLALFEALKPLVSHLNDPFYTAAFEKQLEKLRDPRLLPSHRILARLR